MSSLFSPFALFHPCFIRIHLKLNSFLNEGSPRHSLLAQARMAVACKEHKTPYSSFLHCCCCCCPARCAFPPLDDHLLVLSISAQKLPFPPPGRLPSKPRPALALLLYRSA